MKIAIITHNPHYNIGGIETTVRKKISFWHTKHEITEFPLFKIEEDIKQVSKPYKNVKIDYTLLGWKPYNILYGGSYTNKNMSVIFKEYDVVIFDTLVPSRKWVKHPKSIIVQHEYQKFYNAWGKGFAISLGTFFSDYLFRAGSFRNPFKSASNSVFFTKYDSIQTKGNTYTVQLPSLSEKEIKKFKVNRNRSGFIWVARIDNRIKNLKALSKISNATSLVSIYGDGRDKKKLLKWLDNKDSFKGFIEHKNVQKEMNKNKALIMTSKFEGFPNTIVEALSIGLPVILFDTFESAKFLEESGAVFLIKNNDEKAFIEKMKWLETLEKSEYDKIVNRAIKFSLKYLTDEIYEQKWNQIIDVVYRKGGS